MWTVRVLNGRVCRDYSFGTKREAHRFAQAQRRKVQTNSPRPGNIRRIGPLRKIYSVYATGERR